MVRLLGLIAGTGMAAFSSAQAGLHLTPTPSEYRLDGVKFSRLSFPDDNGKEVTYTPPTQWRFFPGAGCLILQPPGKPQAEASVAVFPLATPSALDPETIQRLTKEALASVPNGSTDVTLISAEKNPVLIGEKETLLLIISYVFHGQRFGRSLLFLNRGPEQVRFQLVAHFDDFAELQAAFLQSHFTWQNL